MTPRTHDPWDTKLCAAPRDGGAPRPLGLSGTRRVSGWVPAVTLIDIASFLASAALLALVRASGHTASREGGSVRARLA